MPMSWEQYQSMEESAALGHCHERLVTALKEYDTGRWEGDKIDCCMTGKDADLAPWGEQGIEIVSVTEDEVTFTVHCLASIPGDDVCLNLPPDVDADDAKYERCLEVYLDLAQQLVCDLGSNPYWSGDDWGLSDRFEVTMPWVGDGDEMFEATARAIYKRAEEEVKPWEESLGELHEHLGVLCGWNLMDGTRCAEGDPGPGSVYGLINWDENEGEA